MSAQLFPTVKGLQLVVSTPVDATTGLIRDDLIGIKVWYSTTIPDFNVETQGTLAYEGDGLNVFLPDLNPATTYYVKYALISFLDEEVYDDSTTLTARPLSGVSVDVRNSNPVTVVPAFWDGTVLSFDGTGTTLRVYEGGEQLQYDGVGTSAGTWKIENSFTNITVPENYITDSGAFLTTSNINGLSEDKGSISFTITGRSFSNEYFIVVTTQTIAKSRMSAAPSIDIGGIARFNTSFDGATYSPANFTVNAIIANIENPTYLWAVTGATTSSPLTNSDVTITPSSDLISISLTVDGSNLLEPIVKTAQIAASYDGNPGPSIDISGITGFNRNIAGVILPETSQLTAVTAYVSNPVYSWAVTNGSLNSTNTQSVVLTPTQNSPITVTLTVSGTNLTTPLVKQVKMVVTQDGATGQTGASGTMSAFPSIYRWTENSTPPTRPTTSSTYTWSSGLYDPPTDWATSAPSNIAAGSYLWVITVPLVVSATTTTSTLDWTNTSLPIRSIAYNGVDGSTGASALTAILTNETHAVPTDSSGNNPVFTNSGTDIRVYEGNIELTYDGVGSAAGAWTVSKVATGVTSSAFVDNGSYATLPDITAMSGSVGSIIYTITGKTLGGASFTLYKTQRFSKVAAGVTGANAVIYDISTSSAVLTKESPDAATTGTYSTVVIQGKKYDGGTTTNYGWITITANGGTEETTAIDTASVAYSLSPASTAGTSFYTIKLYNQATVSGATLLDTQIIYVVFKGNTGSTGSIGAAGSATYVVTRTANDDSAPTNAEVVAVIGRNPVAGDIVTVSYNNANGAKVYKYTTSWALFTSYLTGSLIVENTITAANMATGTITAASGVIGSIDADTITAGTITGRTYQTSSDVNASKRITINSADNNQMIFTGAIGTPTETYGELARLGETTTTYYINNILVSSPAIFSAGRLDQTDKVGMSVKSWDKPALVASSARGEAIRINCSYGSGITTYGLRMDRGTFGFYVDASFSNTNVDNAIYIKGYNNSGIYVDAPKTGSSVSTHGLFVECNPSLYRENTSAVKFGDAYFGRRDTSGYGTFVITNAGAGSAISLLSHSLFDVTATTTRLHRNVLRITKGNSITEKVEIDGPYIYVNAPSSQNYGIFQTGSPSTGIQGSGTSYDFYASGTGTNYGPFTGAHDGLLLKTVQPEVGDIVTDHVLVAKLNISNTIFEQKLSSTINDTKVVGVLVAVFELLDDMKPAALKEYEDYETLQIDYNRIVINAVGEGQVNVCKDGGDIQAGDYITTSNRPGKGMKQADDIYHSYTVAKARESVSWSEGDDTIKQIACIYLCG